MCLSQQHCAWRLEQLAAPSVFAEYVAEFMKPGPTWLINPLSNVSPRRQCPHRTLVWERGKHTSSPTGCKKIQCLPLCGVEARFCWLMLSSLQSHFLY